MRFVAIVIALIILGGCQEPSAISSLAQQDDVRDASIAKSMKLYEQGMAAAKAGELDKAQRLLGEAASENDRNVLAWMELGIVEFRRQKFFEAAAAFDRASKLEPTRYEPRYNMGLVLESAGCLEKAAAEYEVALTLAPEQLEVMENLVRSYVRIGSRPDQAKDLVDRSLLKETRPEWRAWLLSQSLRLPARGVVKGTLNYPPPLPARETQPADAGGLSPVSASRP